MLKFLYAFFSAQTKEPVPDVVELKTGIYSSIYNETSAQGHFLAHAALQKIKEMLDSAYSHPTESPMMRAQRAYAGYRAVEEAYVELLTNQMREWIETKHGEAIRELHIEAEIAELLPQSVEPPHQRFRESAEDMFRSRATDLRETELVGIFENRYDPMAFVRMPEWISGKEQK